jgi:predicted nuclease of predicted toxin-antitoxin system
MRENRVLVTSDLDFGRLYHLRFRGEVGIIVLRIRPPTFETIQARVRSFLREADLEELTDSLVLLESRRYRILR